MYFNTDSTACDCRCECGYLPKEDWNYCPFHGDWEHRCQHSALEKIAGLVDRAEQDSELNRRQLGALRWAIRTARATGESSRRRWLDAQEL